jgi:hypothetical protein
MAEKFFDFDADFDFDFDWSFLRCAQRGKGRTLEGSSFNHQRSCKLLLASDTRPCRANISSKPKSKSKSKSGSWL